MANALMPLPSSIPHGRIYFISANLVLPTPPPGTFAISIGWYQCQLCLFSGLFFLRLAPVTLHHPSAEHFHPALLCIGIATSINTSCLASLKRPVHIWQPVTIWPQTTSSSASLILPPNKTLTSVLSEFIRSLGTPMEQPPSWNCTK